MTARFLVGDVFEQLATLDDDSVDLVLTSPPFLALRSYLPADHIDKGKEIGSEATPADFLDTLLDVVEACGRVLGPYGSLVFELGDTYSGSGGAGGDYNENGLREGQNAFDGSAARNRKGSISPDGETGHYAGRQLRPFGPNAGAGWPMSKSLALIPQLFSASLAYGRNLLRPERLTDPWRVRNVVAWCRPNPPVGALGDKFRPATSYLTVACKGRDRWFDLDAVREEFKGHDGPSPGIKYANGEGGDDQARRSSQPRVNTHSGAPPLDWWEIPTQPYRGAHYASFPEKLVVRPILSMCPREVCTTCGEPRRRIVEVEYQATTTRRETSKAIAAVTDGVSQGHHAHRETNPIRSVTSDTWSDCGHNSYRRGLVLDPFAGSGTTLAVAEGLGRDSIGIDLDTRNADLARERCGMFLTVETSDREGAA